MQKLQKANLYRSELIPINGKLVERYNKCLVKLGFTVTKLTSFSIDGLGWSPEIAEEKNEVFYLNNGEANPHAIIISPLQKGLPIYNPFHSFDVELMKLVFKTHQQKIQNITRDSAICVDFDQSIDVFYEPLDVLKYKDVKISFRLIDDLDKAKEEQLQLIETFKRDTNFIDENLHQQLLTSAKKYGDLRERDLNLDPIIFTSDSFYTKAFGGIYLLRNFITPILIFEEKEAYKEAINDTTYDVLMFHVSQPQLVTQLRDHLIIECNLEQELGSKRYERIKNFIFGSSSRAYFKFPSPSIASCTFSMSCSMLNSSFNAMLPACSMDGSVIFSIKHVFPFLEITSSPNRCLFIVLFIILKSSSLLKCTVILLYPSL